jgi:hypothetical protein
MFTAEINDGLSSVLNSEQDVGYITFYYIYIVRFILYIVHIRFRLSISATSLMGLPSIWYIYIINM